MSLIAYVINALDTKMEDLKVIREKRKERINLAYSESNSGLEPNWDNRGRLHAPCDGYEDIDGKGIYGKGEYLPIPEIVFEQLAEEGITCDRGNGVFGKRSRVMIELSDSPSLIDMFRASYGLISETGKSFIKDEVEKCYLYVHGNDSLVKVVDEAVKDYKIAVMEAERELKGEAPSGKCEIHVKLLFIKVIEPSDQFGFPGIYKMMCEADNKATIWGTFPKALHGQKVGTEFVLRGTFQQAKDDKTHAFVSRPSVKKS